jgi:hypothetical protein
VTRRLLGWAVLSAFLIVARLSPAGAADLLLKAPPHAPPIYSWTGCYLELDRLLSRHREWRRVGREPGPRGFVGKTGSRRPSDHQSL